MSILRVISRETRITSIVLRLIHLLSIPVTLITSTEQHSLGLNLHSTISLLTAPIWNVMVREKEKEIIYSIFKVEIFPSKSRPQCIQTILILTHNEYCTQTFVSTQTDEFLLDFFFLCFTAADFLWNSYYLIHDCWTLSLRLKHNFMKTTHFSARVFIYHNTPFLHFELCMDAHFF